MSRTRAPCRSLRQAGLSQALGEARPRFAVHAGELLAEVSERECRLDLRGLGEGKGDLFAVAGLGERGGEVELWQETAIGKLACQSAAGERVLVAPEMGTPPGRAALSGAR